MFDIDCAVGEVPCLTADDDHGFEIDEAEVIYWGRCPTAGPVEAEAVRLRSDVDQPTGCRTTPLVDTWSHNQPSATHIKEQ